MLYTENDFSLLIVDDDPLMRKLLKAIFRNDDYILNLAESGAEALSILKETHVDAALVDFQMPGMDGLTLLKAISTTYPGIMVAMLTGRGGIQDAVQAIKHGAVDFLTKPITEAELRIRVDQLFQMRRLQVENERLREELSSGVGRMIGNSTPMVRLKEMIGQVGNTEASVLIQGETGTGKELVAKAIHMNSPRAQNSFVPIDCAAISGSVTESELFGHVKGAFTGAHTAAVGLVRSADGGTVFFDEIGELSPEIQAKLLRTIQEREVRPVGSARSAPVDIRILAATNRDLSQEVGEGRFREDLYYRLNVVTVGVPPLRERREDIALLARYFVSRLESSGAVAVGISRESLELMNAYDWPGNVRELENVITRAGALGTGSEIVPADLPSFLNGGMEGSGDPDGSDSPVEHSLAAYERAAIVNALRKCNGNRRDAGQMLDIGEATLYRKIKTYNINLDQ
jgi:DNA-binding NtrC family response regulator